MNVSSRELCEKLYELSGWGDPKQGWKYTEPMSTDIKYGIRKDGDRWCYSVQKGPISHWDTDEVSVWPAYDLGYLLRKIPLTFDNYFFDLSTESDVDEQLVKYIKEYAKQEKLQLIEELEKECKTFVKDWDSNEAVLAVPLSTLQKKKEEL